MATSLAGGSKAASKTRIKRLRERILNKESDLQKRENFFEELLAEAVEAKNVIIFIDNMDQYISSDRSKIDLTTSFEKFAKTNQLQFCFNEEKIHNNFRPDNSPLFGGMVSLINVEYKIAEVASAFHSLQGFADDDKNFILTHFQNKIYAVCTKLGLINKFLLLYIKNPDADSFDVCVDFDEEERLSEEPII